MEQTASANARVRAEVRAQLARQRLSYDWLADQTGIARRTLDRRMRGESGFDVDEVDVIAHALGVPVAALIEDGAA